MTTLTPVERPAPARGAAPPTPPAGTVPSRGGRRKGGRTRRRLAYAGAALLLLLAVVWSLRPSPVEVETARVTRGPLRATVDEDGITRVADRYVVAAPVSGRVERIGVREGDAVAAGAVLARIASAPVDPRTARQAEARLAAAAALRREAEARLGEAGAGLAQARRDAARARTLAAAGALSESAKEAAELAAATRAREVEAAAARVRSAAAEIDAARAALADADPAGEPSVVVEVRAPAAGRVLRVPERSARPVAAGTPLVELGDADVLEVVVDVLSANAVGVRPGAAVEIAEWGGEGVLRGEVRRVEPSAFTRVSALGVEEQRVNVIAGLAGRPGGLGDGFRVEARIVTWEAPSVLRLPSGALFREGAGWGVFVVEDGRVRKRVVRIGHRGGDGVEVLGGVREGESVVLFPSDQLREGVRARAR
ncbi:MAG TPA: efflux RND transporter periplasmic adaptor subunit [Longimicrobiaceae bacterium]